MIRWLATVCLLFLLGAAEPGESVVKRFYLTHPCMEADTTGSVPCSTSTVPLTDLDHLEVRWYAVGKPDTVMLGNFPAVLRECTEDSFTVSFPDSVAWAGVIVRAVDRSGNRSCPVQVLLRVSVPVTAVEPGPGGRQDFVIRCDLFDIRGRRVRTMSASAWYGPATIRSLPLSSGIYFLRAQWKSGKSTARKVVLTR